jgi:uncharacterized membrane protein YphA (DoxX/SURF4 family)
MAFKQVLPFALMISNGKALALLRIAVGAMFLIFAEYKVVGRQFTIGGGIVYWIDRFLQDGAYPFMVPVLKGFVLPHATIIAFLAAYGELAIGLALALGILVRTASVCGLIYMLTLLFASNYPGPHAALWQYFGASAGAPGASILFCDVQPKSRRRVSLTNRLLHASPWLKPAALLTIPATRPPSQSRARTISVLDMQYL